VNLAFGQTTDVRSSSWGVAPAYLSADRQAMNMAFGQNQGPKLRNFEGRGRAWN